jgi:hypothetical protein
MKPIDISKKYKWCIYNSYTNEWDLYVTSNVEHLIKQECNILHEDETVLTFGNKIVAIAKDNRVYLYQPEINEAT